DIALSNIPVKHLAAIKEIRIDPGNDPGGIAAATTGFDNVINVYLSGGGAGVGQKWVNEVTAHEIGHAVSNKAAKADPNFWDKWDGAIKEDKVFVSQYAQTNHYEDFAETYLTFLAGFGNDPAMRARFSKRYAM